MNALTNANANVRPSSDYGSFEGEDTLRPGTGVCVLDTSTVEAHSRPMAWNRVDVVDDGFIVLPGGYRAPAPEIGRVLTVEMDRGYLVHVERIDDDCLVTVEPPQEVIAPVDDAALAGLALDARATASGDEDLDRKAPSTRKLRKAWAYRRSFERLAEGYPGEGGPVVPVRWTTLSYEGRVHVKGIGTFTVDDAGIKVTTPEGREIVARRIGSDDGFAPVGAVEIVVGPLPQTVSINVKSSAKVIRL